MSAFKPKLKAKPPALRAPEVMSVGVNARVIATLERAMHAHPMMGDNAERIGPSHKDYEATRRLYVRALMYAASGVAKGMVTL